MEKYGHCLFPWSVAVDNSAAAADDDDDYDDDDDNDDGDWSENI